VQGIAVAIRYPYDAPIFPAAPPSPEAAVLSAEAEAAMEERRAELCPLLRNAARLVPDDAAAAAHDALRGLLQQPDAEVR
jgi:hypothetical protein